MSLCNVNIREIQLSESKVVELLDWRSPTQHLFTQILPLDRFEKGNTIMA